MTHEEAMALLVRAGAEYVYEDTRKAIAAEIIAAVEAQRQKDAALVRDYECPLVGEPRAITDAIADAIEAQE